MKNSWEATWKTITEDIINKHYYGHSSNIRGHERFIKEWLGASKHIDFPQSLAKQFDYIYEAKISWYHPVPNTVFFHDKFKDIYIFFDVSNPKSPRAMIVITGLTKERMGNEFDDFLKWAKRNKVAI